MGFLTWTSSSTLLAPALVAPAHSQSRLPTPEGWTQSAAAGDILFSQPSSGCRLVIKKLSPLGGSLRSWFDAQTERDSCARGQVSTRGAVELRSGSLTQMRSFRTSQGTQVVVYVGYAVGSQGRLWISSGPSASQVAQSLSELNEVGARQGAADQALMRNGSGTAGSSSSKQTKKATPKTSASRTPGAKLAPVAAKGTLKSSQVTGVYLSESYTVGVGGSMVLTFDPVLLLRNGSARRDLEVPPTDLNLARDKSAHRKDWGRWSRSGGKIVVRWPDGGKDELRPSYKTRPARAGQTLSRAYTSMDGGGNTALGGDVMVFYSNSYKFARDGSFTSGRSGGGMSSSMTASSSSKDAGRYRLDGNALTLKFNDGRTVRRLFYFYSDKDEDVIGIGDDAFIGEK